MPSSPHTGKQSPTDANLGSLLFNMESARPVCKTGHCKPASAILPRISIGCRSRIAHLLMKQQGNPPWLFQLNGLRSEILLFQVPRLASFMIAIKPAHESSAPSITRSMRFLLARKQSTQQAHASSCKIPSAGLQGQCAFPNATTCMATRALRRSGFCSET